MVTFEEIEERIVRRVCYWINYWEHQRWLKRLRAVKRPIQRFNWIVAYGDHEFEHITKARCEVQDAKCKANNPTT